MITAMDNLKHITPDLWNNIPLPLTEAITCICAEIKDIRNRNVVVHSDINRCIQQINNERNAVNIEYAKLREELRRTDDATRRYILLAI